MNVRRIKCICLSTLVLLAWPVEKAMALQTHAAPEGIYVHQMAHVLFTTALVYLFWHTRRTQAASSKGWHYFQLFCIFLIAWNILAFTGHWSYERLQEADFGMRGSLESQLLSPLTFAKIIYYISKMDHFLIVPALAALVAGLRQFYLEARGEARR
ncbi:MAG: hypothetical protein ACK5PS_18035 [Desulfopila sp.]